MHIYYSTNEETNGEKTWIISLRNGFFKSISGQDKVNRSI